MTLQRPVAFAGIEGQDSALTRLTAGLTTGRLSHALGFVGPQGVGRLLTAQRLAAHRLADTPADWHAELALMQAGAHPDFLMIAPDTSTASNDIKVESARKLVSFMQQTPSRSPWRFAIIDQADRMNVQAANGILKVLEEPPAQAQIVLVLQDMASVLPTIRSRLVALPFQPLPAGVLQNLAKAQGLSVTPEVLAAANGSLSRLAQLADPETQAAIRHLDALMAGKMAPNHLLALVQWAATQSSLAQDLVLTRIWQHQRSVPNKNLCDCYGHSRQVLARQAAYNLDAQAAWVEIFDGLAKALRS